MAATALDFVFASPAARVLLGPGRSSQIAAELDLLGVKRVLFVCTPGGKSRYKALVDRLGDRSAAVFARAEPHVPEPVAEASLTAFADAGADGVVTVGGGSTIGVGKFIAARRKAPLLCVPTTLSGSEMTSLYGVKIGNEKRTSKDIAAKPCTVIYDPNLTQTLPKRETATTGMNCLAHCVEALYPAEPNPIARLLALEGIRHLATSLPGVIEHNDPESRARALYAGFIGGLLVSMVGIGLHHAICHVLGGHFAVPHGESNSVMLPHVVAFNAPSMPAISSDIAQALATTDAAEGIAALGARIGAPVNLRDLGLPRSSLIAVAEEVVAKGTHNPRPVTVDAIRNLLIGAWEGHLPTADQNQRARKNTSLGGEHYAGSAAH